MALGYYPGASQVQPAQQGGVARSPKHEDLLAWANALRQTNNPNISGLVPGSGGGGQIQKPQRPLDQYTGGPVRTGEPTIADYFRYHMGRDPSPYEERYYTKDRPDQLQQNIIAPGQYDGRTVYTYDQRQGTPYRGQITPIDQRAPLPGAPQATPIAPPTRVQSEVADYLRLGQAQQPGQVGGQQNMQQAIMNALRGIGLG